MNSLSYFISSNSTLLLVFLIVIIILGLTISWTNRHVLFPSSVASPTPPAPLRWPVVGNLLLMTKLHPHRVLMKLMASYSCGVLSLKFGVENVFVVSDPICVKDVTKKTSFSGRPKGRKLTEIWFEYKDMVNNDGFVWAAHRKICHSALIHHNKIIKRSVLIEREAREMVKALNIILESRREFNPHNLVSLFVSNIMTQLIISHRYESYEDPEFVALVEAYQVRFRVLSSGNPSDFIPALRHLPFNKSFTAVYKAKRIRDDIFKKYFDDHVENCMKYSDPRDYLDVILREREIQLQKGDLSPHLELDSIYQATLNNFYAAGMGTTVETLTWALLFLVNNPKIQDELYTELTNLQIQNEPKIVKLSYGDQLPFLQATIQETLRIRPPAPLGLPHRAIRDTKLGKYNVDEDTTVLVNIWALHHDEQLWTTPGTFNPHRFLGDACEGKINEESGIFSPFGTGTRKCVGFEVALDELVVLLGTIVLNFEITSKTKLSEEEVDGITIQPKPFEIVLKSR